MSSELNWLPKHKASLTISHNEHKSVYEDVETYVQDFSYWVSESERKKAIESGELWEIQWYPDTPIGFYNVCASSLDALRAYFDEVEK